MEFLREDGEPEDLDMPPRLSWGMERDGDATLGEGEEDEAGERLLLDCELDFDGDKSDMSRSLLLVLQ